MSKVTLLEVAKAAGVSIGTASRAVNRQPRVSATSRRRVEEAVRKLGYLQPSTKQRTVAILIPTLEVRRLDDYFCSLFSALRNVIHRHGYRAVTISREDYPLLNDWPVSGAVSFDYTAEISRLFPKNSNIPLICCNDRSNHLENVYSVQTNYRKIMYEVVGHLVGLGHTRIGYANYLKTELPAYYDTAMKETITAYGLEAECRIRLYGGELSLPQALEMLLQEGVTAIVVISSSIAADGFLKHRGLRIPQDISLVAGDTLAAPHMTPRHTVITIPYEEMAERAVSALETVWNGGALKEDIIVDSQLIIRESTGPAPERR